MNVFKAWILRLIFHLLRIMIIAFLIIIVSLFSFIDHAIVYRINPIYHCLRNRNRNQVSLHVIRNYVHYLDYWYYHSLCLCLKLNDFYPLLMIFYYDCLCRFSLVFRLVILFFSCCLICYFLYCCQMRFLFLVLLALICCCDPLPFIYFLFSFMILFMNNRICLGIMPSLYHFLKALMNHHCYAQGYFLSSHHYQ